MVGDLLGDRGESDLRLVELPTLRKKKRVGWGEREIKEEEREGRGRGVKET